MLVQEADRGVRWPLLSIRCRRLRLPKLQSGCPHIGTAVQRILDAAPKALTDVCWVRFLLGLAQVKGLRGVAALPHTDFWLGSWALVMDGCALTREKLEALQEKHIGGGAAGVKLLPDEESAGGGAPADAGGSSGGAIGAVGAAGAKGVVGSDSDDDLVE